MSKILMRGEKKSSLRGFFLKTVAISGFLELLVLRSPRSLSSELVMTVLKRVLLRREIIIIIFLLCCITSAEATKDLPVPRFVTIKFDEVNARTGPAVDCPIEWVFITKGEPVEIIAEYDQWRKIRDIKSEGGWVHSSVLSGNRSVVILGKNVMPLLSSPTNYDEIVVKVSPGLRCVLLKCKKEWCQLNCSTYKGWIARKYLWGVYPDE